MLWWWYFWINNWKDLMANRKQKWYKENIFEKVKQIDNKNRFKIKIECHLKYKMIYVWTLARVLYIERNNLIQQMYRNQSWMVLRWMSWILLCNERGRITALSTIQLTLFLKQKVEKLDSQVWPQVPLWSISHQRKSKLLKFLDRLDLDGCKIWIAKSYFCY